jgi:serine/threonine protein kinase
VGCIFAELLVHEAFFRGDNPQHQLEVIVSKMGVPPIEKLDFISSQAALNSILSCRGQKPPSPFASHFPPTASPLALDLLQQMLQFHPDERVSVEGTHKRTHAHCV